MPDELMRILGAGCMMLAGATVWQAFNTIVRWNLGDVVLGGLAGGLAYWLIKFGWRMLG